MSDNGDQTAYSFSRRLFINGIERIRRFIPGQRNRQRLAMIEEENQQAPVFDDAMRARIEELIHETVENDARMQNLMELDRSLQQAENLRESLPTAYPRLRRVNDGKGQLTNSEMAHMLEALHRTVIQVNEQVNKSYLPAPGVFQGCCEDSRVWRRTPSACVITSRIGMLRLNEFTSEKNDNKPFDQDSAMLELHKVIQNIKEVAEIAKPYVHTLPLADASLLATCQALDSLAEAINPSEERPPQEIPDAPKDYRVCVAAFRHNVFMGVMKTLWDNVKHMLEVFMKELKPQEKFIAVCAEKYSWMQNALPKSHHDEGRLVFEPSGIDEPSIGEESENGDLGE